jgi:hypothetical protein
MTAYACKIIPINFFDSATLTASIAALTNTSVNNLKNNRRSRTLRWTSASGIQTISGTWGGTTYPVAGFGLRGFNFDTTNARVRLRGFLASDWTGTAIIDTGYFAPRKSATLEALGWSTGFSPGVSGANSPFIAAWLQQQTIGSFTVDCQDLTNAAGYSELDRIVLGSALQPTSSAKFGIQLGFADDTEQDPTDGGGTLSFARVPRKIARGNFTGLTAAERLVMHQFLSYVGKSRTFMITFQASEGSELEKDYTFIQGKFTELNLQEWMETGRHGLPFSIVES